MRPINKNTTSQLIAQFVNIALAQDKALLDDEIPKFNRLFDQMQAVVQDLKARKGDERRALLSLYDHANMQAIIWLTYQAREVMPCNDRPALKNQTLKSSCPRKPLKRAPIAWQSFRGKWG